jgi:hypothetical protein
VPRRRILGSPYPRSCIAEGPMGPESPDSPGPVPNPKPYILWFCIKIQEEDE